MRRPLCIFTVILVLGVIIWFSEEGRGTAHRRSLQPSFYLELTQNGTDSVEEILKGKVRWIETGPEKDTVILYGGKKYGKVRISVEKAETEKMKAGSEICIRTQCCLYEKATNPGQFNLRKYEETLGYYYFGKEGKLLSASANYSKSLEMLRKINQFLTLTLDSNLSAEDAAFLKSLLLGNDNYLSETVKEQFEKAGMLRFLRLTGAHVTLIGLFIYRILKKRCRFRLYNIIATLILVLPFVWFSAFRISVIRAYLILCIRLFSVLFKRKFDLLSGASLTILFMILENPFILWNSSIQFYFSVLFAAGILMPSVSAILKKYHRFMTPVLFSLSFQCCFLPVTLYYDYEISFISPFVQLISGVITGMEFISGFSGLFAGSLKNLLLKTPFSVLFQFLTDFFFGACRYLKNILTEVSIKINQCTWATLINGRPEKVRILIYMGLIVLFVVILQLSFENRKKIQEKKERNIRLCHYLYCAGILFTLFIFGLFYLKAEKPEKDSLEILMLDVGQGDSFIIRTREETILLDCGSTSKKEPGENILIPALKYYGIDTVDCILISHPDTDHINGINELIDDDRIKISQMYFADISENQSLELKYKAELHAISVDFLHTGDILLSDDLKMTVLSPEQGSTLSGNDASLVILVEKDEFSALFMGDIGEEYENLPGLQKADLLKVAHHGSAYSTTETFLNQTRPEISLISCGLNNSYGHPSEKTVSRLEDSGTEILRTDLLGAVEVTVKDGGYHWRTLAN